MTLPIPEKPADGIELFDRLFKQIRVRRCLPIMQKQGSPRVRRYPERNQPRLVGPRKMDDYRRIDRLADFLRRKIFRNRVFPIQRRDSSEFRRKDFRFTLEKNIQNVLVEIFYFIPKLERLFQKFHGGVLGAHFLYVKQQNPRVEIPVKPESLRVGSRNKIVRARDGCVGNIVVEKPANVAAYDYVAIEINSLFVREVQKRYQIPITCRNGNVRVQQREFVEKAGILRHRYKTDFVRTASFRNVRLRRVGKPRSQNDKMQGRERVVDDGSGDSAKLRRVVFVATKIYRDNRFRRIFHIKIIPEKSQYIKRKRQTPPSAQ